MGGPAPARRAACGEVVDHGRMQNPASPGDPSPAPASRLPDLGPRGEGWVAIQLGLFLLLALAGTLGPAWEEPWLTVGRVVGSIHLAAGIAVAGLGLLGLRENLTAVPRPVDGGRLISHGIYGRVRHPIYTGIIAAGVGWGLVTASPAALAVAVLLGVFFDVKARREEAWLVAAYPGYADYRRRVRKLLPLIY